MYFYTTSAREATEAQPLPLLDNYRFNSRLHTGGDVAAVGHIVKIEVSIHASAREATYGA